MRQPPALIRAYLAFSRLSAPIWHAALKWRAKKGKEDPARLSERWGHPAQPRPEGELLWLHGVSVGEVTVLLTLLERLSQTRPQTHFLLTSITRAAADAMAKRQLPARVIHHYAPADYPGAVARFLDHWRPDAFVLSEMDLWPRLLAETHKRGIPMAIVNAHVTPRRLRNRKRAAKANGWLMDLFGEIHVQDDRSAALFAQIGAPMGKMQVTGLLKAASTPPPDHPQARAEIAAQIGDRPRWLAASTRTEEEAQVMQVHAQALAHCPDLLMIIAPRQLKDADRTEADARAVFDPARIARRSKGQPITAQTQVYIADSMGEMGVWLRLVPVAYPGQSLPLDGRVMTGKNPFEAVALGVLVVHGPHVANFRAAYDLLAEQGAALRVSDAKAMTDAVIAAQDPACRAPYLAGAAQVQAQVMAPLERAEQMICKMLPTDRCT
ncbi:3-deoxy-D-manno-octulosonic acid transferase [Roseibaca ekhonensis]|uniref:3-deoxy-D-manno-octulosonic acid transferase n=1 Tax=Roseinatronobacter ekhonensis TaxID=254356 RepID=A0A3B0MB10_9RHOB|nr:glycosyltransferase N-terminal domain-containing protein [Roseibaca ekhonensis]SUZ33051.1 3-deoxy-D-manno-octulosonic acid transferase [Roseibaca ekhonensis]